MFYGHPFYPSLVSLACCDIHNVIDHFTANVSAKGEQESRNCTCPHLIKLQVDVTYQVCLKLEAGRQPVDNSSHPPLRGNTATTEFADVAQYYTFRTTAVSHRVNHAKEPSKSRKSRKSSATSGSLCPSDRTYLGRCFVSKRISSANE